LFKFVVYRWYSGMYKKISVVQAGSYPEFLEKIRDRLHPTMKRGDFIIIAFDPKDPPSARLVIINVLKGANLDVVWKANTNYFIDNTEIKLLHKMITDLEKNEILKHNYKPTGVKTIVFSG